MNVEINGERLRELRRQKALERRELERTSGVHFATIVRIELGQGTARLNTVKRLATALGVDTSELAGNEVANSPVG